PVLGDDDVIARYAGLPGEFSVRAQVPPFAMDWHEIDRLDHVEHVKQLTGRGVPGDGHERVTLVHDAGTEPGQVVNHPPDGGLVARYQRGREDHRVAGGDPDRMITPRHPRQR